MFYVSFVTNNVQFVLPNFKDFNFCYCSFECHLKLNINIAIDNYHQFQFKNHLPHFDAFQLCVRVCVGAHNNLCVFFGILLQTNPAVKSAVQSVSGLLLETFFFLYLICCFFRPL